MEIKQNEKLIMLKRFIFVALCFLQTGLNAQEFLADRPSEKLTNWDFAFGDYSKSFSGHWDEHWTKVTVPHTWNAIDVLTKGPGYYQGTGTYRAKLNLSPKDSENRHFVRFEGVSMVCDVYVNYVYVTTHKGGYTAFTPEITKYLNFGGENNIIVRVSNVHSRDVTPTGQSLYPLFGGIYRPVTYFSTAEDCVSPLDYGSSGVYVHQKEVSKEKATIDVEVLISATSKNENLLVKTTIFDNNVEVMKAEQNITSGQESVNFLITINSPKLWAAKDGANLYQCKVEVVKDDKVIDEVGQTFGLRFFHVDPQKGFYLNGKQYPLYGITRHQEWQGLGSALTDEHHKEDFSNILEIGSSAIRLAHYPQADIMYRMADENGIVVWAEIPVTPPYTKDSPQFVANCQSQLTEMIKQNYNHPSILFWGMFNEVRIPKKDLKAQHDLTKSLDPVRLTTFSDNTDFSELHTITDLAAWNMYHGWYGDNFNRYTERVDGIHEKNKDVCVGIGEFGAGGDITQHSFSNERPDPIWGRFYPEEYQSYYHEQVWKRIAAREDIWSKFIWNLADFSWTTVKRGSKNYRNNKGLITHDRKIKKDAFYFFKANWSDEPVLYITSRRFVNRIDKNAPVKIYSNLKEVNVYHNNKKVAKLKNDSEINILLLDNLELIRGKNMVRVEGVKNGKKYSDECIWNLQ